MLSRCSDSLRVGRSGDRIQVGSRYSAPVQTGAGAHPASNTSGYRVVPGGKATDPWRWPLTPSSAEIKERVELYTHSPSGLSWPLLSWILSSPLLHKFCNAWRSLAVQTSNSIPHLSAYGIRTGRGLTQIFSFKASSLLRSQVTNFT